MTNFAPTVVNHGRGLHDSPPGLGATHSILQRRTHRKCLVEQSRHVSRQKTCVVSQPPITPGPGQCSNETVESRINQVNQTHSSISRRRGGRGTGWPTRRRRGRGRGFGDRTRGTMVEAHDKRQPVDAQPPITPATKKGKGAATTSKIPIVKKATPSTSRGDIRSRLEAVRERRKTWEKHLAESGFAKGKGKGKGPAREVERLKPLPGWEDWAQGKKLRRRLDYDSD